jgi:hypothetical protein
MHPYLPHIRSYRPLHALQQQQKTDAAIHHHHRRRGAHRHLVVGVRSASPIVFNPARTVECDVPDAQFGLYVGVVAQIVMDSAGPCQEGAALHAMQLGEAGVGAEANAEQVLGDL